MRAEPAVRCALGGLLLAAALGGCAALRPFSDDAARATADALDADRAMAAAVAARDPEAFAGHLEEDAVFLGGGAPLAGRAAVLRGWAGFLAPEGPLLGWRPDQAEGATGGDLVVTWGSWTLARPGSEARDGGRYLTVWRRGADGLLRVAIDAGDTPLPALPPSVTLEPLRTVTSADGRWRAEAGLLVEGHGEARREAGHALRLWRQSGGAWRLQTEAGAFHPAR